MPLRRGGRLVERNGMWWGKCGEGGDMAKIVGLHCALATDKGEGQNRPPY